MARPSLGRSVRLTLYVTPEEENSLRAYLAAMRDPNLPHYMRRSIQPKETPEIHTTVKDETT